MRRTPPISGLPGSGEPSPKREFASVTPEQLLALEVKRGDNWIKPLATFLVSTPLGEPIGIPTLAQIAGITPEHLYFNIAAFNRFLWKAGILYSLQYHSEGTSLNYGWNHDRPFLSKRFMFVLRTHPKRTPPRVFKFPQ